MFKYRPFSSSKSLDRQVSAPTQTLSKLSPDREGADRELWRLSDL